MQYSSGNSNLSPVNKLPAPRAGIIMFSVQMETSGIANWFQQHGLQNALRIATYVISCGMSVLDASVQRMNWEIMSLLTSNTPGGITTCTERSAMPIPRQPIPNSCCAMFSEDSTYLYIIPVSGAISRSPTSSIRFRLACLTTSSNRFSPS